MNTGRPYADVMPGPRGQIFATLAQMRAPLTIRALARQADVSPQRALDIIRDLTEAGLVHNERAGSAQMVSLNRRHVAAAPLIELVSLRKRLVQQLEQELRGWPDLAGAWLFGSTVRGDGDRTSDIDVFLVSDSSLEAQTWLDATDQLREHLNAWTGNEPQLIEHTRDSLARLIETENPLVDALRVEGVPLTRTSSSLLRRAAA